MSQHDMHARVEEGGTWLPLTEYAVRSGISLSTIRRKIKTNSIPFRLDRGRYLIFFETGALPTPRLVLKEEPKASPPPTVTVKAPVRAASSPEEQEFPLFERTVRMISQAFEHTLKEKDERIALMEKRYRELEERLSELRTLVRVLEEKFEVRY